MKVIIIATEASGDYLGYHLIKSLRKKKKNIQIFGVGGKLMNRLHLKSWVPIKMFNTIGLVEVLIRIFKFIKLLNFVEKKIREISPDILITIDSPSFNYRLAKRLQDLRKNSNTKFIHYVAPTVWAWKEYRAKTFSTVYDYLFTLFKFENKFFKNFGLKTKWVGHQIFYEKKKIKKKKIICLLPGSRETEIKKNMNVLKYVIPKLKIKYPKYKINILNFEHYTGMIRDIVASNVEIITDFNLKQKSMMESTIAIAASGSVTLELSKYRTPTIVIYDTNIITRMLIKSLVKVKYCSIINIFFKKEVIPELIFEKFSVNNLIYKFDDLMNSKSKLKQQIDHMKVFSDQMITKRNPSETLVDEILKIN